ncbi:MAG: signal peptidase I [Candidatus Moranbacteria bacterium]|nr:signal peptidase I [Candidatus Moranbacteria bacterium]
MNNRTQKILKIIENTFIAVATFLVAFLLLSLILPKFEYNLVIIQSGSMEPTIKTGSVTITKQMEEYQKDDVITFTDSSGTIITHRIIETIPNEKAVQFKTKGDNNNTEDLLFVNQKSVIGKTLFSIPLLGHLIGFAKTTTGIILIFFVPATWIAFEEVKKIKKEIINRKSNK